MHLINATVIVGKPLHKVHHNWSTVASQVTPTQRLQGADAVLAVRTKVSQVPPPRHTHVCMQSAPLATAPQLKLLALTLEPHRCASFAGARLQPSCCVVGCSNRRLAASCHLLTRPKLHAQGSWVRQAARDAGVPIFVVKTAAPSNLTRALRTLLGFDPSAGGTFAGWRERNSQFGSSAPGMSHTAELPDAEYPAAVSSNVTSRVSMQIKCAKDPASVMPRAAHTAGPEHKRCVHQAVAENETEAMDEARLAVQQIVLARQQPSELLPRAPPIIALQVSLA